MFVGKIKPVTFPAASKIEPPLKFKSPEQSKLLVFSPEPTIYWKYNVSEPEPLVYVALPPEFKLIYGVPLTTSTTTTSLKRTFNIISTPER